MTWFNKLPRFYTQRVSGSILIKKKSGQALVEFGLVSMVAIPFLMLAGLVLVLLFRIWAVGLVVEKIGQDMSVQGQYNYLIGSAAIDYGETFLVDLNFTTDELLVEVTDARTGSITRGDWYDTIPLNYGDSIKIVLISNWRNDSIVSALADLTGNSNSQAISTWQGSAERDFNNVTVTPPPRTPGTAPGKFTGHVYDSSTNLPLEGVQVCVLGINCATTNPNGFYVLPNLGPAGNYDIEVRHTGYLLHAETAWAVGGWGTTLDIYLNKAASISGIVESQSGTPLAGVSVEVVGTTSGTLTTTTDGTGYYELTPLYPEPVTIVFTRAGFVTYGTSFTLNSGEDHILNVTMVTPASLEGYVYNEDGTPVANATITLSMGGTATSDSTGYYQIENIAILNPTTTTVSAAKTGYISYTSSTITLQPGDTNTYNVDPFMAYVTLTGYVRDHNGVSPWAGLTVSIGSGNTTTNGSGYYSFGGLLPGNEYTVTVIAAPGYDLPASHTWNSAQVISGASLNHNFNVARYVNITGYVTDGPGGAGIAGASIVSSNGRNTTTNASGYYSLTDYYPTNPGTDTWTIAAPGFADSTVNVLATSGDNMSLNLPLLRQSGVQGVVRRLNGSNVTGTVSYSGTSSGSISIVSGAYSQEGMEAGPYTLTPIVTGYDTFSQNVTLADGTNAQVANFYLARPATVSGTVNFGGNPVSGTVVTCTYADNAASCGAGTTDGSGVYTINGVKLPNSTTPGAATSRQLILTATVSGNSQSATPIFSDGNNLTQNFNFNPQGNISGNIRYSYHTSAAGSLQYAPISGATITAGTRTGSSNGAGDYLVSDVLAGSQPVGYSYTYTPSTPLYDGTSPSCGPITTSQNITVTAGNTVAAPQITLDVPGHLVLQINYLGSPNVGANITINGSNPTPQAPTTDAQGRIYFTCMAEGTYTISARRGSGPNSILSTTVWLRAGTSNVITINF